MDRLLLGNARAQKGLLGIASVAEAWASYHAVQQKSAARLSQTTDFHWE